MKAFLLSIGLLLALAFKVGLILNDSPSVPTGLYRSDPSPMGVVGEMVCFDHASDAAPAVARSLLAGRPKSLKVVAARAGSVVEVGPAEVHVDGEALPCSGRMKATNAGVTLPQPPGSLVVPQGHVWLASPHPAGLDSRYYGPVSVSALSCGNVQPIWTAEDGGC